MSQCNHCINHNKKNNFYCDHCGKIYKIKLEGKTSIFSIFGLKSSFNINRELLDKTYSELIKLMHPDRFINDTADNKLIAEENTAIINKAYSILSSEIGICQYILSNQTEENNDVIIEDEDDFLVEKMHLYEELSGIKSINECIKFKNRLTQLYGEKLSELRGSLLKKQWVNGNKALYKIRFIQNLLESLEKRAYMLERNKKIPKK